jgi:hypothetical protein
MSILSKITNFLGGSPTQENIADAQASKPADTQPDPTFQVPGSDEPVNVKFAQSFTPLLALSQLDRQEPGLGEKVRAEAERRLGSPIFEPNSKGQIWSGLDAAEVFEEVKAEYTGALGAVLHVLPWADVDPGYKKICDKYNGRFYTIRDNWAIKKGLMKPVGPHGYTHQIGKDTDALGDELDAYTRKTEGISDTEHQDAFDKIKADVLALCNETTRLGHAASNKACIALLRQAKDLRKELPLNRRSTVCIDDARIFRKAVDHVIRVLSDSFNTKGNKIAPLDAAVLDECIKLQHTMGEDFYGGDHCNSIVHIYDLTSLPRDMLTTEGKKQF